MKEIFKCILFDGEDFIQNAIITIENGKIISIEEKLETSCSDFFCNALFN